MCTETEQSCYKTSVVGRALSSLKMLPVLLLLLLSISAALARVLPPSPSSSLVMTTRPASLSSPSSPLTCSAAASGLRPDLLWLRDGVVLSGGEQEGESRAEMSEVTSVLEPGCSHQPQVFTCLAVAGEEKITSETLVLPAQQTEECRRHQKEQQAATITTWDSNLLVELGGRVELRCEEVVAGVVRPGVWLGQAATASRAAAGGRLVINNLQWADMGLYTCTTHLGTRRSTFLYPLTAE